MSKYEFLIKHGHFADEIAEVLGERHTPILQDLLYLGYTQGRVDATEEQMKQFKTEEKAA